MASLVLSALAHPTRLELFRLLVRRGPAGYAAGEVGERLGIAGPTLSFHLKELAQAGLIESRREGRFLHYSASMERMNALMEFLTEHCCTLGSSGSTTSAPSPLASARRSA